MVCRSAFSAILPDEVIESAEIDGSNEWQTFGHIAVRLHYAYSGRAYTVLRGWRHWNNFFTALLYLSKEELMPMQVLLRRVLIQASSELMDNSTASNDMAAVSIQVRYVTIVVATLPILAIYPLLQKYFVKGVMLGAVKVRSARARKGTYLCIMILQERHIELMRHAPRALDLQRGRGLRRVAGEGARKADRTTGPAAGNAGERQLQHRMGAGR